MALAASLQHLGERFDNAGAHVLSNALESATAEYLRNGREPSRKVHELDNRGSTFYLTLYWAQALAAQDADPALAELFGPVAAELSARESEIVAELNAAQGQPQDVGGYYMPDPERAAAAMRPSTTLNRIIDAI
jgi:isocitrate dehydrogenase